MNIVVAAAAVFATWVVLSVLAALVWGRVCALNDDVQIGEGDLTEDEDVEVDA